MGLFKKGLNHLTLSPYFPVKELATNCKNLGTLDLNCTKVTDAGVKELATRIGIPKKGIRGDFCTLVFASQNEILRESIGTPLVVGTKIALRQSSKETNEKESHIHCIRAPR